VNDGLIFSLSRFKRSNTDLVWELLTFNISFFRGNSIRYQRLALRLSVTTNIYKKIMVHRHNYSHLQVKNIKTFVNRWKKSIFKHVIIKEGTRT